jgi:rod shape-determining protein MreC
MDTFLGRYKNLIVLAAILFAQIIALALQVRRPGQDGETRLIRLWAISAVTPIEKAVVHSQEWVHNVIFNYAYLRGVRRENRQLRAEIERMKLDDMRLGEDARMARRVQALLAFREQYVDKTVAAQVIGTSGSEQSRVLYLDKGSKDGIKPDMAVITPGGIVGKVVQVYPDTSQVQPINDQFSGVGAALKSSRLQGILRGSSTGALTLQYIMSDEKVEPGEEVMTSGGDRIFPKGLPVGKVVSVEPGKDLFLSIRVAPFVPIDRVEEVLVVTRITEKLPDTNGLGPLRASDILAERLPGVPNKDAVDAAGNAKAAGAAGATAAGVAAGNAAHPVTGVASTTKPGTTGATPSGTRPAGTATTGSKPPGVSTTVPSAKPPGATARSTATGAANGTNGTVKSPKPATGTATPNTTVRKPLNGTATNPPAESSNAPSNAAPSGGENSTSAPSNSGTAEPGTRKPPAQPKTATPDQPAPTPSGQQAPPQ